MIHKCYVLDDAPPDDQPTFSTTPIPLMYLNKGDTVIAGCSTNIPIDSTPLSWAFENHTEILYEGINIKIVDVPLSFYGPTNLLVDTKKYNYHNVTYLCQILLLSGGRFATVPVKFFVYGKYDKIYNFE